MKNKALLAVPALCAGAAALGGFVYYQVLGRNAKIYDKTAAATSDDISKEIAEKEKTDERGVWFDNQTLEKLKMKNDRGQLLTGWLLKADKPSDVYVLCSHGYRSHGRGEFRLIARHYHEKGFNVLMVDHQAAGESEGSLITFGYNESKDIIKWAHHLCEAFGENIKIILHGVSMGCATVTMASGDESLPDNVKYTVADCGYTSMNEQFRAVLKSFGVPSFPLIPLTEMWNMIIGKFRYSEVNPLEAVTHARVPMLFIHGSADTFVPTEMVYKLYDACSTEKDILIVDGAIHARSYFVNGEACDKKTDEFIEKYI